MAADVGVALSLGRPPVPAEGPSQQAATAPADPPGPPALTAHQLPHELSFASLTGDYRHLLHRPRDLAYSFVRCAQLCPVRAAW
jgi:hypothetical protein